MIKTLIDTSNPDLHYRLVAERLFEDALSRLPVRSYNLVMSRGITVGNFMDFTRRIYENPSSLKGARKTRESLLESFVPLMDRINSLPLRPIEDIMRLRFFQELDFLSESRVEEVFDFYRRNGYFPVFLTVVNFYRDSKNRNHRVFGRHTGILSPKASLTELAMELDMTRERMRQIIANYNIPGKVEELFEVMDPSRYTFLRKKMRPLKTVVEILRDCCPEDMESLSDQEIEGVIRACSSRFKICSFGKETYVIAIDITDKTDFLNAYETIASNAHGARHYHSLRFEALEILGWDENDVDPNRKQLFIDAAEALAEVLKASLPNLQIEENNVIVVPKTSLSDGDIESCLYNILEEVGKPITIKQMTDIFNERFPEYRKEVSTMSRAARFNGRIIPIGKTGLYKLPHWKQSEKTIRALIHSFLEDSPLPLSLQEISSKLLEYGKETSISSINTNILSDNTHSYLRFRGGLVGLSGKEYPDDYAMAVEPRIQRKSIEENLKAYLDFIDENRRFPFTSGNETEARLCRWYYNVTHANLDATPAQLQMIYEAVGQRRHLDIGKRTFNFIENCNKFAELVKSKGVLPISEDNPKLVGWYRRACINRDSLNPAQSDALDKLQSEIKDYMVPGKTKPVSPGGNYGHAVDEQNDRRPNPDTVPTENAQNASETVSSRQSIKQAAQAALASGPDNDSDSMALYNLVKEMASEGADNWSILSRCMSRFKDHSLSFLEWDALIKGIINSE